MEKLNRPTSDIKQKYNKLEKAFVNISHLKIEELALLPFPKNRTKKLNEIFFIVITMPIIKLQSSDGEIFPVDVDIARQSVTIKTMLDDLGMDEDEEEVVPLPNVNAGILKKVKLPWPFARTLPGWDKYFFEGGPG